MSLFNTMNVSASGLETSATTLGVIGDNIANVNTVGFKGSRASFADLIPQSIGGLGGGGQLGRGAGVDRVTTMFGQGSITATGSVNDMAISGAGFFALRDADGGMYYSRNGAFNKDQEGYLNLGGMRLQGYQAVDGQITGSLADLRIDEASARPHEQSTNVALTATLDAEADFEADDGTLETPLTDAMGAGVPPDGTDAAHPDLVELSTLVDAETSITIFDSRGVAHEVSIYFERTGEDTWNWVAAVDAGQTGGLDGKAHIIDGGELEFDGDGTLVNRSASTFLAASWSFEGTDQPAIDFQFGLDDTGAETGGGVDVSGTGQSPIIMQAITQDGAPKGELVSYEVGPDGTITGSYSNGEEIVLGQVALAGFPAEGGLQRAGSGLYTTTAATGDVQLGVPGSGGRGAIYGYSLEKSNVDLESQFVEMIQTQRSYQANARVVNTASDTLQELINLV